MSEYTTKAILALTLLLLLQYTNSFAEPSPDGPAQLASQAHPINRDAKGKIIRSAKEKNIFKILNPCPLNGHRSGPCPGYVIDHITPLACGGLDKPINMQWQTIKAAKEKDRWERNCR